MIGFVDYAAVAKEGEEVATVGENKRRMTSGGGLSPPCLLPRRHKAVTARYERQFTHAAKRPTVVSLRRSTLSAHIPNRDGRQRLISNQCDVANSHAATASVRGGSLRM